MSLTLTQLRANLYKVVDNVIQTGLPVIIIRKGKMVKIIPVEQKGRLSNIKAHPGTIVGDPESIVHMDWSDSWNDQDHNL